MPNNVEWSGDEFLANLKDGLTENLEAAAIHLVNSIKQKLNTSQPYTIGNGPAGKHYHGENPSAPGEAPHKLRGDLQRSIAYEMSADGTSAIVGSNLEYAAPLELGTAKMAPRPYLRSTVLEEADKLTEIMARAPK